MEIKKIYENAYAIEDTGVRFFLLEGEDKALMIDAGMTATDALKIARGVTDKPVELILTHADRDHTAGAGSFPIFYMHPAEAANFYKSGGKGDFIPVWDGDVLDLGGKEIKVIFLPGHTPGGIALLDVKARALFSGDPVQRNGGIYMFGRYRDLHVYIKSLDRLMEMKDSFDLIYPAHADCPITSDVIPALRRGAERVLSGEIKGEEAEMHGTKIRRCDVGVSVLLCDL